MAAPLGNRLTMSQNTTEVQAGGEAEAETQTQIQTQAHTHTQFEMQALAPAPAPAPGPGPDPSTAMMAGPSSGAFGGPQQAAYFPVVPDGLHHNHGMFLQHQYGPYQSYGGGYPVAAQMQPSYYPCNNIQPPETPGSAPKYLAKKRKPGRPKGSKNKKKRNVLCGESGESSDSGLECREENLREVKFKPKLSKTIAHLPDQTADDISIPALRRERCSNCEFWLGRYLIEPCFHYSFCFKCLQKEDVDAKRQGRDPICLCCKQIVTGYLLGYRCSVLDIPM